MTHQPTPADLASLLERVEKATADDQWDLLRAVRQALVPISEASSAEDDDSAYRYAAMLDANAYESAALALVGRVQPGWGWAASAENKAWLWSPEKPSPKRQNVANGATPALALIAALLRSLMSCEVERG